MGAKKELTPEQRGAILYGFDRNESYRAIATHIGCSKTVVGETIKRFLETGTTQPAKRTGRPPLIHTPARAILKKIVTEEDRHLCASKVTTLFNSRTHLNISKSTVRRGLYKENLKCHIARAKPLVSDTNSTNRLSWCLARNNWTTRQFRHILWSDECSVSLFQQRSCCHVWREPNDEWKLTCLMSTIKHSPSRMYWSCFS